MIRAGIIGGAGYTAGELLRILVNHPQVEIAFVQSSSNASNPLWAVHSGLFGETDLRFCETADLDAADVVFLCSGHGKSSAFWAEHTRPKGLKVIDLAQDYRDERQPKCSSAEQPHKYHQQQCAADGQRNLRSCKGPVIPESPASDQPKRDGQCHQDDHRLNSEAVSFGIESDSFCLHSTAPLRTVYINLTDYSIPVLSAQAKSGPSGPLFMLLFFCTRSRDFP